MYLKLFGISYALGVLFMLLFSDPENFDVITPSTALFIIASIFGGLFLYEKQKENHDLSRISKQFYKFSSVIFPIGVFVIRQFAR